MHILQLERIERIDERIDEEMQNLLHKKETLKNELDQFNTVRNLQEAADETKTSIDEMMDKYSTKLKEFQDKNKEISIKVESNKKMLDNSHTWKEILYLEKKIQSQEQNIFNMKEFIHKKQTDYTAVKDECLQMVDSLNNMTIGSMSKLQQ